MASVTGPVISRMSKIILHIDFNSFFASVEQQANPFLRGKAIAVGGKGRGSQLHRTVVTTASKEAKALGIKTAMASLSALKQLPGLIMVSGDPKKYSEITKRFLAILRKHADAVEQFSTDEASADITVASGGDYFGATIIAQMIREDIKKQCGTHCTASIGVAPNKVMAKLAAESMKPSGLTVVRPEHLLDFVAAQELQAICGIGPRIAERLERLGATTVESLRKLPIELLRKEFKSYGDWLYAIARGQGDDHVSDEDIDPKSIGHSYTFPYDLETDAELKTNLLALSDKVAWRLRRDGFIGTRVSAYVRYQGFGGKGAQQQLSDPIVDGLDIFKNAWSILERVRNPEKPVRLLGVSISGLIKTPMMKTLIPKRNKMHRTLEALDTLQERYGNNVWRRGATMQTLFLERTSGWHYDHEV